MRESYVAAKVQQQLSMHKLCALWEMYHEIKHVCVIVWSAVIQRYVQMETCFT
jgi:hypothetical protein